MIEFGMTLRTAREAKGYTIAQVAEITHMAPTTVEDLEKEDFTHIAAPIYGRGFVKLYCEAVGLDPKPLVAEFMEIFNGNHDISIKERPNKAAHTPAPTPPPATPEPQVPAASEQPAREAFLFAATERHPTPEQPTAAQEAALRTASVAESEQPVLALPADDLFAPPKAMPPPTHPPMDDFFSPSQHVPSAPRLSRYAAPVSQTTAREPALNFLPPNIWRIAALVSAAIVVIWLGFLGVRALYRATSASGETATTAPTPTAEETISSAPAPAATAKPAKTDMHGTEPAAKRTPQDIPALYID